MTKYSIVEFADGMQMVPTSWLQTDDICLWPNYTNQIKINKAIAQLQVPCTSTWSKQLVLRTFGTAKTHGEGMTKLKLAEKLSDIDTAVSDEEKLSGKRGRRLRAKRCISSDDDDIATNQPPKKKLPPFPKMPKDFGSSNSAATQLCPAEERDKDHFVEDSEDEGRQTNSTPAEEYSVTERADQGHFVETSEDEQINSTATSTSTRSKDTTGLSKSFRKASTDFGGNAVLEAKTTDSNKSIKKKTSRSDIVERPQSHASNKSQAALMEFSKNETAGTIDHGSQQTVTHIGLLKEILRKILKLYYLLRKVDEKIDEKNDINITEDDAENWDGEDHNFPLKDQKALDKFEVALQDKTYMAKMVRFMKTIGGTAESTIIVNVLKYVLSNTVALDYSWSGARKKKAFKELNICRLLIRTVRSASSSITDDKICGVVSKWLAQAKLRHTRNTKKLETEKTVGCSEKDAPDE